MLDVELNLILDLSIVLVSIFKLEVGKKTVVVVKAEELLLLGLVPGELLLEVGGDTWCLNIFGSTIVTVTILWHKCIDVDSIGWAHDCLIVIDSTAVVANELGLFNSNNDVVWKTDVHKRVNTTSVFLEHLGFGDEVGEVCKDEAVSSLAGKSKELEGNLILDKSISILGIDKFLSLEEEWVHVLLVLASKLRDVSHECGHREDWKTNINAESLNNFILEGVRSSEEDDLWLGWPSLQVLSSL